MKFYLTLPINDAGSLEGLAATIRDPAGYESEWYWRQGDAEHFRCPDGGATTKTAKYARCEMHGETKYPTDTPFTLHRRFAVTSIPVGHKVVVFQPGHDGSNPLCKIAFDNHGPGKSILRAAVKINGGDGDDVWHVLLTGLSVGDLIYCKAGFNPNTAKGTYYKFVTNGKTKRIYFNKFDFRPTVHEQYGNYYQNKAREGNICEVVHYAV